MFKIVETDLIAKDKVEEHKAWVKRAQKVFEKHGLTFKVWRIEGRKAGQVFQEFGEHESRAAADAAIDKIMADKEWQDLSQELDSELVVKGSREYFHLTDY